MDTDALAPGMDECSDLPEDRRAEVGSTVVIAGHHVGEHERIGEILQLLGEPPHERYLVRWDDDRESVFYPGSDATIRQPIRRRQPKRSGASS